MENPKLDFDAIIFAGDDDQLVTELSVPAPPMIMGDDLPISAKNRIAAAGSTSPSQPELSPRNSNSPSCAHSLGQVT